MNSQRALLLCARWQDVLLPIAGAALERCVECRSMVWVSPSAFGVRREHRPFVLCIRCAMVLLPLEEIPCQALTE